MKKFFTIALCVVVCLMLDNTLMPFIAIKGYFPSLLLVFAISYSILNDMEHSIIIGVTTGLLQDIYFNGTLGVNALSNLIVCIIATQIGRAIFKEKFLMPVIFNFGLSLLKGIILIAITFFIKQTITLKSAFYISLYNFVVAIFMYQFLFKLSEKSFMKNYWKF
ncbi:rod shape-determining protein MreD [Hathewaya histolytica]|uniref:Rod shape-determining protein MreD n=1 Tax=Hathewaya histolytica TaxID=1498 RepID=A0A4U9RG83_HATHI|nr:rod shape-determining protein MreD [Hathewaya histolytica]VTQ90885.1 rod shape-determining protein MreD [Hathewaya histolytica]